MKKLTKIKLVNWHLFSDETIVIKDNSLISGENGSGKSTLLDALQYLLVGGKSSSKFNIAATDDAKRTLEGYVRGRIGAENKEFLRTKDVVTHVCLEFYDERQKINSIIGCVLALPQGGVLKERQYLVDDIAIDDSLFLDEKRHPRDFTEMKAHFKTLGRELESFETQKKYRESLSRFFGLDAVKYAKILPKALAFRSIDLQKFVFDFLLDDDPIDIQSLKNNVAQLKKVEQQIKSDREKLEKLDKINDIGGKITESVEQLNINKLLDHINWIDKSELVMNKNDQRVERLNQRLEELRKSRESLDDKMDASERTISELISAKSNNDVSRTITNYQEALRKKEEEYNNQKEAVAEIKSALEGEFELAKDATKYMNSKALGNFIKYYQANNDNLSPNELTDYLTQMKRDFESYQGQYGIEKNDSEKEIHDVSEVIRQCSQRLHYLQRNVKTYSSQVTSLIDLLEKELTNKYQKEVTVRPLCELIEVNDEKWRNALEGFLNTQRFDIIVDPKYFNDALEIYDKAKFKLGLYGVGLVNTNMITKYDSFEENTLASKIDSDHIYARCYANMLMGSTICVDNVQDLKNHSRSVTATCMTYGNHTARQMNPRSYEIPYIGQKANTIQIEIETSQLKELEGRMAELQAVVDKDNQLLRMISQSKATYLVNQNQLRLLEAVKQTRKECADLEDKLKGISKDSSLVELDAKLDAERLARQQLNSDRDNIVGEVRISRDEIEKLQAQNEETKLRLEEYVDEQKKLVKDHPEMLSIANDQYTDLKERCKRDYNVISKAIVDSNNTLTTSVNKQKNDISNLMNSYTFQYHFGADPDFSALVLYETEANKIRNNNLVRYEQEATELRKASETGFREEFVNKLRACIENAQQQISDLNYALKGKAFGNDSYQLIYRASESPDFKVYYDIIMSNTAFDTHELFTENLTKKNEQILMELFEKIASSDPQYDKLTFEFLDYRNYMSYDIEITNINGNTSYFSKVSKEKSGGETQVPFYIVIAASFQQLLSRNKNTDSGCVVLFDEAFNNMDESRIDAMMKFYNSLSIQLFIAVPPQRVPNIISYVNTTIAIVKDNDYATVVPYVDSRMKD